MELSKRILNEINTMTSLTRSRIKKLSTGMDNRFTVDTLLRDLIKVVFKIGHNEGRANRIKEYESRILRLEERIEDLKKGVTNEGFTGEIYRERTDNYVGD